jgi:hypothetical protein
MTTHRKLLAIGAPAAFAVGSTPDPTATPDV